MAGTKKTRKPEPAVVAANTVTERPPAKPIGRTIGPVPALKSLRKLAGSNAAGKQHALLEYIRFRGAGMNVAFDIWLDVYIASNRDPSPSQVFAPFVEAQRLDDEEQVVVLLGYVDKLNVEPDLGFGNFLQAEFGDPTVEPVADDHTDDDSMQVGTEPDEPEREDEPPEEDSTGEAEDGPEAEEPAPEPPVAKPAARRRQAAATQDLVGSRVACRMPDGAVIYGIVTKDDGTVVTLLDDAGAEWTSVDRKLVRAETGPIVWTIDKPTDQLIRRMTVKGRGVWTEVGAHHDDVLFELVRRVTPTVLCVVNVHNAKPEPYIDAFVYDESAGVDDNPVVFELKPRDQIAGDYLFKVPGLGDVAAKVVVR
jgi:hypothetical protein